MSESWKPVVGFEGMYEVSDHGRVKSLARIIKHQLGGPYHLKERILKSDKAGKYAQVNLRKNGFSFTMKVHWIVMEAFVGSCPDGLETRHLDGDYQNPRLSNLVYGTKSENQMDRVAHGTSNRGERCAAAVLNRIQVLEIRELLGAKSNPEIASMFGVSRGCIKNIRAKRTWAWL